MKEKKNQFNLGSIEDWGIFFSTLSNNNNLNMNRVDECMLNTDPYLTYKGAQTLSRQGNYSQSNYYSNYGNYGGASTTTNAVK